MRLIYATQFEVGPSGGEAPLETAGRLKAEVAGWISAGYLRWWGLEYRPPLGGGTDAPVEGHEVRIEAEDDPGDGSSYWSSTWGHPTQADEHAFWQTQCEVATSGGRVEFSLALRFGARAFLVAPPRFILRRPRLVRSIVSAFACTVGGRPLPTGPVRVDPTGLDGWVDGTLRSPDRRLPIVVVSREPRGGRLLADPAEVADKVVGLAEVHVLDDPRDSMALTRRVGSLLSCYNGAVRIYWPGFGGPGPQDVPVYLPDQLDRMGGDRTLGDELLERLAEISTTRAAAGPVARRALEAIDRHRDLARDRLRRRAEDAGEYSELLRISEDENARLRRENARLADRLEEAISRLERDASSSRRPPPGEGGPATAEPADVAEAVERAESEFADTLTFLKSAHESARLSPYAQPRRAFEALAALDFVCRSRREAKGAGRPMGPLFEAFRALGFEYKPRESITAKGRWGGEYQASYDGRKVSIEPHLAVGNGPPAGCLRIHFFIDEEDERFVVAHVGKHKTNTRS